MKKRTICPPRVEMEFTDLGPAGFGGFSILAHTARLLAARHVPGRAVDRRAVVPRRGPGDAGLAQAVGVDRDDAAHGHAGVAQRPRVEGTGAPSLGQAGKIQAHSYRDHHYLRDMRTNPEGHRIGVSATVRRTMNDRMASALN